MFTASRMISNKNIKRHGGASGRTKTPQCDKREHSIFVRNKKEFENANSAKRLLIVSVQKTYHISVISGKRRAKLKRIASCQIKQKKTLLKTVLYLYLYLKHSVVKMMTLK